MAYGNWGGWVFLNNQLVRDRSDICIDQSETQNIENDQTFHILLGSGPVYLGVYKTFFNYVFNVPECLGMIYTSQEEFNVVKSMSVNGTDISLIFGHDYILYTKVEHSNGEVWAGFVGGSVGNGFPDAKSVENSKRCVKRLNEHFNLNCSLENVYASKS